MVRQPDTTVIVKPVIDLNDHLHVEGYEIPHRLADQITERDHTCVFPWCTRPVTHTGANTRTGTGTQNDRDPRQGHRADIDHVIPHDQGGQTASDNLAPLCRRHHRLKTHSRWTYTVLEPGSYLWTSPHGYHYHRDTEGTLDVNPDRRASRRVTDSHAAKPPEH